MGIAATSTAAVEIIQVWTTACRSFRWSVAVLSYLIRFHPEKARARRTASVLFVLSKKTAQKRKPRELLEDSLRTPDSETSNGRCGRIQVGADRLKMKTRVAGGNSIGGLRP